MRTLTFAVLAAALLAAPPPAAAQSTAPPPPTDSVRVELVRALGFARASVTQLTKTLAAHDRARATPPADTATTAPPVVTPPPDSSVPTPPVVVVPRPADPALPASTVTLPQAHVDITMPAITGRVLTVGASLQAALDSARGGDLVVLEPGVTYTGAFRVAACHTSGVVVTTAGFPVGAGQQVTPADSVHMARLASPGANAPTLSWAAGSCGWRLVGVHVTAAPGATVGALVSINGHDAKDTDDQPQRIILDRVLVLGRTDQDLRRCVTMNGAHLAVIDSWLGECHAKGADSQAIVAWQGSGPFLIEKNHLEGAGENVMFGGADSRSAELLPSDITIRGNHFTKPAAWKGVWTVKNLLEFKVGRRVLVEGNVLEGSWPDGQTGTAVVMKTSNQSGTAPWSETSDVTIVGNLVRDASNGINLAGKPEVHPAVPASRFYIANNAIQSGGRHVLIQGVDAVTLAGNSFAPGSHGVLFTGTQRNFVATGNRWGATTYGVTADAKGYGSTALANAAPGAVWERNAMQSGQSNTTIPAGSVIYRAGDVIPAALGATLDVAQLLARVVGSP